MAECCTIVGAEAIGLIDVGGTYAKGRFERIFPPGIELGAWCYSMLRPYSFSPFLSTIVLHHDRLLPLSLDDQ
jgi:hypothetical protein